MTMFRLSQALFAVLLLRSIKQFPPTTAAVTARGNEGYTLRNALGVAQILLERCLKGSSVPVDYSAIPSLMRECLVRRSILVLDRLRTIDHLRICGGVDLVRYRNDSEIFTNRQNSLSSHIGKADWGSRVMQKLDSILQTRLLKIQMQSKALVPVTESRRRHRGGLNQMYPLILFGTMAMTLIAIPMGFQFLAVLGGKALLLAKLALILTSIQGLKKIATSNLNYGLYQANPSNPCKQNGVVTITCLAYIENNDFDLVLGNDVVSLSVRFEDITPSSGHFDRNSHNGLRDDRQEVDVGYPVPDLLHPLSSTTWSERIK